MKKRRQGEIALLLVKEIMRREPVRLDTKNLRKKLEQKAREFNVPKKDFVKFSRILIRQLVDEVLR